jgi:hypothetical protein
MQSMSVKHLFSRASGREIDRSQYADAVEKITSAIMKPTALPQNEEINEHILAPLNANGVQSLPI